MWQRRDHGGETGSQATERCYKFEKLKFWFEQSGAVIEREKATATICLRALRNTLDILENIVVISSIILFISTTNKR